MVLDMLTLKNSLATGLQVINSTINKCHEETKNELLAVRTQLKDIPSSKPRKPRYKLIWCNTCLDLLRNETDLSHHSCSPHENFTDSETESKAPLSIYKVEEEVYKRFTRLWIDFHELRLKAMRADFEKMEEQTKQRAKPSSELKADQNDTNSQCHVAAEAEPTDPKPTLEELKKKKKEKKKEDKEKGKEKEKEKSKSPNAKKRLGGSQGQSEPKDKDSEMDEPDGKKKKKSSDS